MSKKFNEILASDGVEAAGGSAREDGRGDGTTGATSAVAVTAPAATPTAEDWLSLVKGTSLETYAGVSETKGVLFREKAPAAAPDDVCEWTQESWEYRKVGCNGYGLHVYSNNYQPKRGRCPYCKWPVQIKSEAAR